MLGNAKIKMVQELIESLSRDEIIWLNGYLAGVVSGEEKIPAQSVNEKPASLLPRITIAYGTETGNAKSLATSFAAKAKKLGVGVKLVSLDQYRLSDLSKEEKFFTIISTQGEGEPPLGAKKFYDHLFVDKPFLSNLNYAVLALGDTSYPLFCKAGEEVHEQFTKLGGTQLLPLQKCDVDFEADADAWFEKVLDLSKNGKDAADIFSDGKKIPATPLTASKTKGKKYYDGKIVANINLNGRGSGKQTYHIEIGVDEVVEYEPGDSLAIVPHNRKTVVDEIVRLTEIDRNFMVATDKLTGTVEELLTSQLNICYLLTSTVKAYAELTQHSIPETRMDLKDLLRIYPVKNADQFAETLKLLKPAAPRLYSISSSPEAHPGEIHLTVGKHSFLLEDEQHFGLCSEFLGEQPVGTALRFYIHKNRAFKLPAADKDIIMIGPGTGIAPFRSFVAERDFAGANGRSWLFFGDQRFTTDFLYQTEWQSWLSSGALTKMNVAFSRDQDEKIYVQHKIKQQSKELFEWIENGAIIYLCGAKGPMNADVENMLHQIISEEKKCTAEEAKLHFEELKKAGRYMKEVY